MVIHNNNLVQIPASIQTVTAFVADACITISLCVILWGLKTGFKRWASSGITARTNLPRRTGTLITTLIVYSVHRGIFTGYVRDVYAWRRR